MRHDGKVVGEGGGGDGCNCRAPRKPDKWGKGGELLMLRLKDENATERTHRDTDTPGLSSIYTPGVCRWEDVQERGMQTGCGDTVSVGGGGGGGGTGRDGTDGTNHR